MSLNMRSSYGSLLNICGAQWEKITLNSNLPWKKWLK